MRDERAFVSLINWVGGEGVWTELEKKSTRNTLIQKEP